ncbi:hypothetical protein SSPO_065760 [Streptomyces antimycoticus]|uniref:Uncharacterized protein n=1 Tax=Streptomyces antimycoticus TaxID=68175 RepID=A0A499UUZ5_9ACTN|nr:hypothetical protein SSPO_065760 [Streptomyces antimycoticus]
MCRAFATPLGPSLLPKAIGPTTIGGADGVEKSAATRPAREGVMGWVWRWVLRWWPRPGTTRRRTAGVGGGRPRHRDDGPAPDPWSLYVIAFSCTRR